jgi:hypothetical protein
MTTPSCHAEHTRSLEPCVPYSSSPSSSRETSDVLPRPTPLAIVPDAVSYDLHRRTDCAHWTDCLDVAAYLDWQGISCSACDAHATGAAAPRLVLGADAVTCPCSGDTAPTPREIATAQETQQIIGPIYCERRIRGELYVLPGSRRRCRIARAAGLPIAVVLVEQARCPICESRLRAKTSCPKCGGHVCSAARSGEYRIVHREKVQRYLLATR